MIMIDQATLEALAPHDCPTSIYTNQCPWCKRSIAWLQRLKTDHQPNCPWVTARALLGDNLNDSV